jgi:hypothetical protein
MLFKQLLNINVITMAKKHVAPSRPAVAPRPAPRPMPMQNPGMAGMKKGGKC